MDSWICRFKSLSLLIYAATHFESPDMDRMDYLKRDSFIQVAEGNVRTIDSK
jgi:HD superfamily phosphohydrolase